MFTQFTFVAFKVRYLCVDHTWGMYWTYCHLDTSSSKYEKLLCTKVYKESLGSLLFSYILKCVYSQCTC